MASIYEQAQVADRNRGFYAPVLIGNLENLDGIKNETSKHSVIILQIFFSADIKTPYFVYPYFLSTPYFVRFCIPEITK